MPRISLRSLSFAAAFTVASPLTLSAQDGYRQPPEPIRAILDAEPTPAVSLSPDRAWLLMLARPALPPISEVAAPELRIAGDRINPRTSGRSREISFKGLTLKSVRGDVERPIRIPEGARIAHVAWSSDSKKIAFSAIGDDDITLWVADAATGEAKQVGATKLNATTGNPCEWMAGDARLLCRTIPASRGAAPPEPTVPGGPIVQETDGRAAPNRTYEDLLASPHDEALFDHFFSSQLAFISLDGTATPVGKPAIFSASQPSPDGRFILVQMVHRPYSYVVPMGRFPLRTEVWDAQGASAKMLADRALQEHVSMAFDAVTSGPRNVSWRGDAPATLVWAEALDGGDPAKKVEKRDRVAMLEAPFAGAPVTLAELDTRSSGITWGRADLALVNENWWKTRHTKTWAVNPSKPGSAPRLVFDRSSEDRYADPGRFVTTQSAMGTNVLLTSDDGRHAYLIGAGASSEGDRPFLRRIELASGKVDSLWRSQAPYYEEVVAVLDGRASRVITRRESVKDVPNYLLRDLVRRVAPVALTTFADPAPQFAGVTTELIRYKRKDGVDLSATLYLPPGYDKSKGTLPFLFWAYPREFKSAAAAAQVQGSPYRFTRPSGASHLFHLLQGYGVLDGPTMPIVGEGDSEPNDTYIAQLVSSAEAAVDKVVEMGVADRNRIAVGGHSYGAFMTANLLAHSKLFKAGIARSGAYNRTLTPFGFQQEERPYWEAQEIYTNMSPFMFANRVESPILLIHGMADDNSGTFPVQSERFFAALKGNGKRVRYVQLPAEAHGYRGRESVGHTLWETGTWLDRYVKGGQISIVP